MKLALKETLCILFGALGLCGCTQNIDILNNTFILEKRISYELEKVYEKRRGFFDVKVSEFRMIEKSGQNYTCSAKISYKISDSWLGEYNEMLNLGRKINLHFIKMDKYEWLSYDALKKGNSDGSIIFSIVSDPKKGGKNVLFHNKIRRIPLIKIFNINFFRDFTNLNRPLFNSSISKTSSKQIDLLNITKYLKENGFAHDSLSETYRNEDSCLKIVDEDAETLFILDSPRVFLFLEHPMTYKSSNDYLVKPQIFVISKKSTQGKRKH